MVAINNAWSTKKISWLVSHNRGFVCNFVLIELRLWEFIWKKGNHQSLGMQYYFYWGNLVGRYFTHFADQVMCPILSSCHSIWHKNYRGGSISGSFVSSAWITSQSKVSKGQPSFCPVSFCLAFWIRAEALVEWEEIPSVRGLLGL